MRSLRTSITICRETELPAEIELEIDCLFHPGWPRSLREPEEPPNIEVLTSEEEISTNISALFDKYRDETISQVLRYLESAEFKTDAYDQAGGEEDAE
jgi:hypothetical protein